MSPTTDSSMHPAQSSLFSAQFMLLLLANFSVSTCFGAFFIFPLYVIEIGGTKTSIGVLMGTMALASVLVRPWVSTAVDKIGRKKSFGIGSLILTVVCAAHIFTFTDIQSAFIPLLLLRFLFGAGFALCIVATFTFATDMAPPNRLNEGISIFGVMGVLGVAVGPLSAEWLAFSYGYREMFIGIFFVALLSFITFFCLKETIIRNTAEVEGTFLMILKHPTVLAMFMVGCCFGIGFSAHSGFIAPFAEMRGVLFSPYFTAYSASAITSRIFLGKIVDRFGERKILPAAFVITAAGFILLLTEDISSVLFLLAGACGGIGHGMLVPGMLSVAVRKVNRQDRGKATGVVTGGVDSGLFAGSMLLGFIGEKLGFTAIFYTSSLFLLLGLFIFVFSLKKKLNSNNLTESV